MVYANQCIYHLTLILQWVNNTASPRYKEFIQSHVEALKQARHLKSLVICVKLSFCFFEFTEPA